MSESHVEKVAVSVKDLYFSYSKSLILNGINLSVPKAKIYGLLGSSGCGKTTLLRCTLGRLKPKSGEIEIFGGKPGSKVCQIPGAGVGYMPQELGLYHDFTIAETLTYFGRIFAMNKTEINEKIDALIKLLQLPKKTKLIGKLSGGQQRRVSLATALFHSPPLLILDEPTVGVDPILRKTIWYHLVSLCRSGLTIILTTHYIEEARSADVVGFMRDGKLLSQDNPNLLLDKYLLPNLEEVFLKLCYLENNQQNDSQQIPVNGKVYENFIQIEDKVSIYENDFSQEDFSHKKDKCLEISSVLSKSLLNDKKKNSDDVNKHNQNLINDVNKNTICDNVNVEIVDQSLTIDYLKKNNSEDNSNSDIKIRTEAKDTNNVYIKVTEDGYQLNNLTKNGLNDYNQQLLPEKIQMKNSHFSGRLSALLHKNFRRLSRNWGQLLFYIILPALQLALLLVSISGGPTNLTLAVFDEEILNNKTNNWGEVFLSCIDNKTFNLEHYDSFEAAYESVKTGKSWAVIDINDRFSSALRLRHIYGTEADEETIEESQIRVYIDWSNQAISVQIERYFYEAMMKFAEQIAIETGTNPDAIKVPMAFEKPVYGNRDESMRDFVLPGCYILLAFFSTGAVTAHLILEERRDGLLDRSLVAGITAFEFLLSHAFTQFLILCIQIGLMLLIPLVVSQPQYSGSLLLMISLALSQGFCGIMYGLMISAICSDIIYAAMFTIVTFFVSIIIGGVFWPLENMPTILRVLSHLTPSTLPIQSMRSILFRGWNLCYFQVYIGFIVNYVWFCFFVIIALIFLRRSF